MLTNRENAFLASDKLRAIIRAADIGLLEWDFRTGDFHANAIAVTHFRVDPNLEFAANDFLSCIDPQDRPKIEAILQSNDVTRIQEAEFRILCANEVRWLHGRAEMTLDASGQRASLLIVTQDITDAKRVERSLREYSDIVTLAPVLIRDLGDNVVVWKQGMEKLYGWTEQEAMDRVVHELLRTIFPTPPDAIREALFTKGHWQGELVHFRKDGRSVMISAHWLLHRDASGEPFAILEYHSDITAIRRSHEELVKRTEELAASENQLREARNELAAQATLLESRVEERTAKLQSAVRSMEEVLYTIAHDLRGPLRAMRGFTAALSEDYASQFDDQARDYSGRVIAAAARMDKLITDLLSFGHVAHMEIPLDRIDLENAVASAVGSFEAEIRAKGAAVTVHNPLPSVRANATLLSQVLANLISNALKFVPRGQSPRVTISAETTVMSVRLIVADNGLGIAKEYRDQIFGLFQRLHREVDFTGTGVGLAIVKKAVERMGGTVSVESDVDKGSRFCIQLPKAS